MSVTFQSLRPMLRTKDFNGTVQFRTERLGFTCDGSATRMAGHPFPATAWG
jgi:hypothetical protein